MASSSPDSTLAHAIENNIALYRAVLSAHQVDGETREHHWTTDGVTPPFYGSLVTRTHHDDAQFARIEELLAAPPKPFWGMKDSLARLDPAKLERLGMRLLFEARWFGGRCEPHDDAEQIQTSDDLTRWERAWQVTSPAAGQRIFPASLLVDEDVTFLAAMDRKTIVGYNRTVPEGFDDLGPLRVWVSTR